MMADPSGLAHAAGRDHDVESADPRDGLALLGRLGEPNHPIVHRLTQAFARLDLAGMRREDIARLRGQRRVDDNCGGRNDSSSIRLTISVRTSCARSTAKEGMSKAPFLRAAACISASRSVLRASVETAGLSVSPYVDLHTMWSSSCGPSGSRSNSLVSGPMSPGEEKVDGFATGALRLRSRSNSSPGDDLPATASLESRLPR